MQRCHFCQKELHEVPFTCRRCGNTFCADHHLPENHNCSRIVESTSLWSTAASRKIYDPVAEGENQRIKRNSWRKRPAYQPFDQKPSAQGTRRSGIIVFAVLCIIVVGYFVLSQNALSPAPTPITTLSAPQAKIIQVPLTTPTPANFPTTTPSDFNIPALEARIHQLINGQRNSNGLTSLSYDPRLASIARGHSADMATQNYFSHYTPSGVSPTERGAAVGYICRKTIGNLIYSGIAENIEELGATVTTVNGVLVSRSLSGSQEELANQVCYWLDE